MVRNLFLLFLVSWLLVSCSAKKQEADLIIHNAVIYTVDSVFSIQQAMAIKDGKIIDFHKDDIDFKLHLKKLLHDECIEEIINNWSTIMLKSKDLEIYLVGNCFRKELKIQKIGKDKSNGVWCYDLLFDL